MIAAKVISRVRIDGGDDGARQVVEAMRELVWMEVAQRSPSVGYVVEMVRERAKVYAVQSDRPRTLSEQFTSALYDVLTTNYKRKHDRPGVEEIRTPARQAREIMQRGYAEGDCDDRATLAAAILKTADLPTGLVLVSESESMPYHHVFYCSWPVTARPRLTSGGVNVAQAIPFDPQEGIPPGEWPKFARREVFIV